MDPIALGAYRKRSLAGVASPDLVPPEFLLQWYQDNFDGPAHHTDAELIGMSLLPVESRLAWLEEMAELTWKALSPPSPSRGEGRVRVGMKPARLPR